MSRAWRHVDTDFIKAKISHKALVPAGEYLDLSPAIDALYEKHRPILDESYDDEGQHIEGHSRLLPEHLNFSLPAEKLVSTALSSLLTRKFEVVPNPHYFPRIRSSLNAAIITGLNSNYKYIPSNPRVLILCTGDGEDLCRITMRWLSEGSFDLVGITELNGRSKRALGSSCPRLIASNGAFAPHFEWDNLSKGKIRATGLYLHNIDKSWFRDSYDLILCHQGLHHILKNHEGVDSLKFVLGRGRPLLISDFPDVESIRAMGSARGGTVNTIELLSEDKNSGIEGTATIRVLDKTWVDPILSLDRLISQFSDYDLALFKGRGLFMYGTGIIASNFKPPSHLLEASKSSEASIMTYVEIRRKESILPPPVQSGSAWGKVDEFPDPSIGVHLSFQVNRGSPVVPSDVKFISDFSCLYAEKNNGVTGRAYLSGFNAYMVDDLGSKYVATLPQSIGTYSFHIESIFPRPPVVLEMVQGSNPGSPFAARVKHWNGLYSRYPFLRDLFTHKPWYETWAEAYQTCGSNSWEGVVIMQAHALSPTSSNCNTGYMNRTARYVKERYPVDVKEGGKIVEKVLVDGLWEYVRDRPDKKIPNTYDQLVAIRDAIPLHSYHTIMTKKSSPPHSGLRDFMHDSLAIYNTKFVGETADLDSLHSVANPLSHSPVTVGETTYYSIENAVTLGVNPDWIVQALMTTRAFRSFMFSTCGKAVVSASCPSYAKSFQLIRDDVVGAASLKDLLVLREPLVYSGCVLDFSVYYENGVSYKELVHRFRSMVRTVYHSKFADIMVVEYPTSARSAEYFDE